MGLEKIISVTGKGGLFEVLAQSKNGFIVQSMVDGKRFPIQASHQISMLSDIAIYTLNEEKPLREVFLLMFEQSGGKEVISHKSSAKELTEYFQGVLPDYDDERVYNSHIKKVVQWYNLLIKNGFDFEALKEEDTETKA